MELNVELDEEMTKEVDYYLDVELAKEVDKWVGYYLLKELRKEQEVDKEVGKKEIGKCVEEVVDK